MPGTHVIAKLLTARTHELKTRGKDHHPTSLFKDMHP
jgi:hypothetical protein